MAYPVKKGTQTGSKRNSFGSKTGDCRCGKKVKILVNKMRTPKFRISRCTPSVKPMGFTDIEGVCRKTSWSVSGKGGHPHPRGWHSNRPSQGPGSTGPRLPQSGALLGMVEGLCGAETVGVGWPKKEKAQPLTGLG